MGTQASRVRPWGVELDTDFETGAGIQLRDPSPGVVTFYAPWDSSPQPMWFHFRIRGAKGWSVRFVLMNANRCLGGEKCYADLRVRPVVTDDPPTMPPSKRRWRRVAKECLTYNPANGQFSFTVRIGSDEAYVAHCYPYGPAEWNEFVSEFKRRRCLATRAIGTTENGRLIPHAVITEGSSAGKKVIWLTARHHSGETPGSWALEGTLRWILSGDPRARQLRRRCVFRVVPFADLDGVIEGYYGKERAALDFNRAYIEDTPRPEIAHILRQVFAMGRRNLAFFDYHAPGAGGPHQVFMKTKGATSTWRRTLCEEYGRALVALSPPCSRLAEKNLEEPIYMADEAETTSTGGTYLATGIITVTNEVSYGLTADDHVLTRRGYLAYGAAIGKAIHRVLHAHADEINTRGLIEEENERTPFPGYQGKAFLGGFQWVPARDVECVAKSDSKGEILCATFLQDTSLLHLACPRQEIGKHKKLVLVWRFRREKKCTQVPAQVTIFYYGSRRLRFHRNQKVSLTMGGKKAWRTCPLKLHPPTGARTVRLSIRINGGPGQLDLRPPILM